MMKRKEPQLCDYELSYKGARSKKRGRVFFWGTMKASLPLMKEPIATFDLAVRMKMDRSEAREMVNAMVTLGLVSVELRRRQALNAAGRAVLADHYVARPAAMDHLESLIQQYRDVPDSKEL